MNEKTSEFIASVIANIIVLLASALIFMWVWNMCIPDIFEGVKQIGYDNSLGILILTSLIFRDNREVKVIKKDETEKNKEE